MVEFLDMLCILFLLCSAKYKCPNFNKEEDEKVRKEKYNITSNDEIVKIMKEMKWKPKRVMHSLKP